MPAISSNVFKRLGRLAFDFARLLGRFLHNYDWYGGRYGMMDWYGMTDMVDGATKTTRL